MRVLLLAPPGAGKGTQATRLAKRFGVEHIASGDIFRQHVTEGSDLGHQVQEYLDRGDLVPDDLVIAIIGPRVAEAARQGGYVLDGFPRNLSQAERAYELAKEADVTADAVIHLEGDDDELLRRMRERAGREGRSDDSGTTARHRLEVYNEKTKPLLDYYRDRGLLVNINGMQPMDDVTADITDALEAIHDHQ
jgi:adenylate kinase